jgi:hypothetical protein
MPHTEKTPLLHRFYIWIEMRSQSRMYPWILCLGLVAMSWFLAPPCFECFGADSEPWEVVHRKVADPTDTLSDIPPNIWLSKKLFRLSVPLIIKVLRLTPHQVIGLHFILGYLTLVLSYLITKRISRDPATATFATAALAFVYFGRAPYFDFWPLWFDGYAYFFLVLGIFFVNPIAVFLAATAAAWTDERAFISLGIVFLFHQMMADRGSRGITLLRPRMNGWAVLLAMAGYVSLRTFMTHQYGMHASNEGAGIVFMQWTLNFLPMGTWTFLEGLWLVYFAALLIAIHERHFFFTLVLLFVALVAVIIAGCVSDITRSGSYFVPLLFIVCIYLADMLPGELLRRLMLYSAGICLLFPPMFVCIDWPVEKWLQQPVFISWARTLLEQVLGMM